MRKALMFVALFLFAATALFAGNPSPVPSEVPADKIIRKDRPLPGLYIVVLKDKTDPDAVIARLRSSKIDHVYKNSLSGFAGAISDADLEVLASLPEVEFIEEDAEVTADETQQAGATWGLDRVEQRFLPLDGSYWYYPNIANTAGSFTTRAYVIDTGISPHANFGGRYLFGPGQGFTVIFDGNGVFGCPGIGGHGTHVAGTIGSNTWGVSKQVALHSVRVLDCNGNGTLGGVIAGVNWVQANHIKPAVANMSLGGPFSPALNTATDNLVGAGVFVTSAAGNGFGANACNVSPASAVLSFTVGATNILDQRAVFSNIGPCIDNFAPGDDITSTFHGGGTALMDGTSMAAPHVAGAAALYLAEYPWAAPAQVRQHLLTTGTANVLTNIGLGSPNLLLFSRSNSLMASFNGTIAFAFQQVVHPHGIAYFAKHAGPHEARLTGPVGTNFDLELYKWDTGLMSFLLVASSAGATSTERVIYHGPESLYFWIVRSAAGTGAYTLRTSQP